MFLGGEKERKIGRKLTYFFSLFSLFWGKYKKGFKACDDFDEEKGGGGRAYLRPIWAANFYSPAARDGMRHCPRKFRFRIYLGSSKYLEVLLNQGFAIQCFLNLPF